jgi:hypothetical protein
VCSEMAFVGGGWTAGIGPIAVIAPRIRSTCDAA